MTAFPSRAGRGLKSLLLAVALSAGLHMGATLAQTAESAPQTIDIPAGNLSQALDRLGEQTGVLITYEPGLVQGLNAPRVSGKLSASEALRRLLSGSGVQVEAVNAKTFVLRRAPATTPAPAGQAQPGTSKREAREEQLETKDLEKVTVTGSRIRGGTSPSPVITIGSEQIQQEGFADLGEVIRSVPQNFNGGQNPGVMGTQDGLMDITGGSALNLRGLGADASLTLLNGRRLAYEGYTQAVDISAIPVEAVERLEIVPDGASAIYGSDAVGGVANVILKPDFDGVTVGVRYGGATEGGLATREYTATAGTTWTSGGLIATFKDVDADPIYARQRSYTEYLFDPYTIYPGSDSRNGLVSVHQSMGDVAELRLDAIKTKRGLTQFVGVATDSYYRYNPETSATLVSPSIEFFLKHDWSITLSGTRGKDDTAIESHLVTAAGSNLVAQTCYCNESRSWEIGAEGSLFPVGGGDARLAVGAGSRKNEFRVVSKVSGSAYGGDERARFAYAELNLPLVSPSSGNAGVYRLELSAAMRGEDYDSFGRVTTPKFGVIYDPTTDLTFKASWGKSFKAPTLIQRYGDKYSYLWATSAVGASGLPIDATALMSAGGNTDLRAERARTWSASLALHPETLPGLEAELTWFDIDYIDRVVQPVNYMQALGDPAYADFVDWSPTPEQIQELFAVYGRNFYNYAGAPYDASKVVAIIHDQYVNVARQRIKGIDLSGSYRFDLSSGQLTLRGSASWLDSTQKTSASQPEQTLAGIVFKPARFNGRIGAVWASSGFSASGFVNYTGGVTNNLALVPKKTASFTTLDTAINYRTSEQAGAFSDMTFEFSAQNLLDRKPPIYIASVATWVPYDATNYSAVGRFVSVSVSKHW